MSWKIQTSEGAKWTVICLFVFVFVTLPLALLILALLGLIEGPATR